MFCTTLRRRLPSVIPTLTSPQPSGLGLRESSLKTHDLSLPLPSRDQGERTLRILLLSSASTTEHSLPETFEQIQHFAALTGGRDIAIVFILSLPASSTNSQAQSENPTISPQAGLAAYTTLTSTLLAHPSIPSVPILLCPTASSLPRVLGAYTQTLTQPMKPMPTSNSALELLPLCTVMPPMSHFAVSLVTDLFPDLRSFVTAALEDRGMGRDERVRDLIGQVGEEVAAMVEFWEDEWVNE